MDSITQAVLGAGVQAALLGRWQGRRALLYGAMLGTLPDLDVVIDYGDAVAQMTYHRGFSHSLFVLSGVALLMAWLARRWRPNPGYSGKRLFLTLWLVLITHVLLDSFTSYGTQLLWPLSTPPVAWSSIFIIDPLYTLPLLVAVLVTGIGGFGDGRQRWHYWGLGLSSLYLAFTLTGKQMAESRVNQALAAQGIAPERMFSTPTPFNALLWRVLVLDGEQYYEALVGWLDDQAAQLQPLPRGTVWRAQLNGSPQHARLEWFTQGMLRYDRIGDQLVVTDLRLGMTGYHPFRFALAEWRDGAWQTIHWVERQSGLRGDAERLGQLWTRIWQPQTPVPLNEWAAELERE